MVFTGMLHQPFVGTLAAALEHFVWQGAALALALFVVIRFARPSANARYVLGILCLAAMALSPVVTMAMLTPRGLFAASASTPFAAVLTGSTGPAADGIVGAAPRWSTQAIVVGAWLVGVLALSLRLAGGWIMTRRFIAHTRDRASAELRWLARRIGDQLAVSRDFEVFVSTAIAVPMLVGWIAPVVILPAAALSGLAPGQIEALIAHELAHVRRHDYLVNLLQSAVETLFFFHPAVWWVSRDVRESREHCCDDLVVGLCDRVVYASALADLAAIVRGPSLALAATDGSLVGRVRRILNGGDDTRGTRPGWMPAVTLGAIIAVVAPFALTPARATEAPQATTAVLAPGADPSHPVLGVTFKPETPDVSAEPETPSAPQGTLRLSLDRQSNQVADLETIQVKLQQEIEMLRAQAEVSPDVQDRREALRAALEKLRALLADRDGTDEQLKQREVALQALEARLKALDEDLFGEKRLLDAENLDQLAEAKAKLQWLPDAKEGADLAKLAEGKAQLEKVKPFELDEMAAQKLKEARIREAEETLAEKAAAGADAERAFEVMKQFKLQQDSFAFTLPKEKITPELEARLRPDKDGNVVVYRNVRKGETELDPKEMQSVIAPALDAGPNDISVVGNIVKHPGHVSWHDGITVEATLKAAGAPPITNTDYVVRLLSQVQVTFGEGGPRVNGRVDEVNADTTLRPGDVIVVSPRVRK